MATPLSGSYPTLGSMRLTEERDNGVMIVTEDIDGWGSPGSTVAVVQRERDNGAWAGEGYLKPRYMTIRGHLVAPTPELAESTIDELSAACSLAPTSLTITIGSNAKSLLVRRSGEPLADYIAGSNGRYVKWSLSIVAPDPRKTGTTLTASTTLASTSGGLTVPFTVPFTIDATTSNGRVALANRGNVAGRVTVRLTGGAGGLESPRITHINSGKSVTFATGLTIPEGSFVDIDMDAHTILAQGTASRSSWVTERGWSAFEPGNNEWHFTAASGAGTMTVSGWPSWL